MGYAAPTNTLDVSNSNTASVFDSTNPVTTTYSRAIANVNLSTGSVQVTDVNAYSGNNGRAAVLANGQYYMVGNAGNGSGNGASLSQLSDNTGVQRIAANSSGNTTAVGAVVGVYGSATGYQRGFSLSQVPDPAHPGSNYAAGSNGVDTVYQVGATGALANGGVIDNATITILPGFNKLSEKVAETAPTTAVPHPFGMYFGDANTLFVADEGDGVRLGVAGKNTTFAGLQEWKLNSGIWSLAQTFQSGLVGQTSTPAGLAWLVQQDGLRNITGQQNADGSWDIWGTTSTVSDELTHDLGADPNAIAHIHIDANSNALNTSFDITSTAVAGERFGGLAIAAVPEPGSYAMLIAGLGLMGFMVRRKRNQQA
jgi:hypothetical protein